MVRKTLRADRDSVRRSVLSSEVVERLFPGGLNVKIPVDACDFKDLVDFRFHAAQSQFPVG